MTKYGDGTVEKLPSGRFRARVADGHGKLKRLGTYDTEEEAREMLEAGRTVRAESPLAQTVADYGYLVINRRRAAGKRSWNTDRSRWKCWVVAHAEFAQDPVDIVTRTDLKKFLRELPMHDSERASPPSNQLLKHIKNLVSIVFFEAWDTDGIIAENIVDKLKAPTRLEADTDHWTSLSLPEIERLRGCATYTLEQRTVFLLAVFTGLRQGELAALEWTDVVDLDGGEPHLMVCRSWNDVTTKTAKSRRVDLIPLAIEVLRTWRDDPERVRGKYVWGCLYARGYDWGWALKKDNKNGVCYLGAKREAGISRTVWFHHLRDTCASHLLTGSWGRKWTVAEVAELLGHTSTWVTERYARIMPGALAKLAAETRAAPTLRPVPPASPTPLAPATSVVGRPKTSHALSTLDFRFSSQVAGIIGHAMGDSNPRPSAPEAQDSSTTSGTCERHGKFVESLARELLQQFAGARTGLTDAQAAALEADAVTLAAAILQSDEVTLAARVIDGDRLMLTHAVELARTLLAKKSDVELEPPIAESPELTVIHRGQGARRILGRGPR